MDLHVCSKCEHGAILVAPELKLPKEVTSIKVLADKKVLALYVSKSAADHTCPYCGRPIKIAAAKKTEKAKSEKPAPVGPPFPVHH